MCKCHWIWKRDSKAINGNSTESDLSRSTGRLQTHKRSLEKIFHQEERRASFERHDFPSKPVNPALVRYTMTDAKIQICNQSKYPKTYTRVNKLGESRRNKVYLHFPVDLV